MRVQTNYVEADKLRLYERHAAATNLKSVSCLTFGFQAVAVGNQVMSYYVPSDSTLFLTAVAATAQGAGAGGANGITLNFTGGSGGRTVNILPAAAVLTQLYPGSGFNSTYEVPGGGFFNCTISADDHGAGTTPTDVWVFCTVRIV